VKNDEEIFEKIGIIRNSWEENNTIINNKIERLKNFVPEENYNNWIGI
jgi:hypothetical protein